MGFFQYLLIALVSALGITAGLVIAWMTKEEQKPGLPYYILLQYVLIIIAAATALALYLHIAIACILAIVIAEALQHIRFKGAALIVWILWGIILGVASPDPVLPFVAVLAFLYALAFAAQFFDIKKNLAKNLIMHHTYALLFFLTALFSYGILQI